MGFRDSGEAFCGIMPLILYCQGKKAPLLPTKPFLLLFLLLKNMNVL